MFGSKIGVWGWLLVAFCSGLCVILIGSGKTVAQDVVPPTGAKVIHDAEYYILRSQHKDKWAAEDKKLDAKLAQLREKFGAPPNIIHIMWDDTAFGDVGIPAINKIRGFNTPNFNRMAAEGILFTRMYSESSCTPSRAAVITGRHPVRSGMTRVGWPYEFGGLAGEEVTTAEVLSQAGYATGFFSKWHLGDIEQSYPHNQGFDEAFFSPYNQVAAIWNAQGTAANASLGFDPNVAPRDPYLIDKVGLMPTGLVMTIEGRKGGLGREWGKPTNADYEKLDPESEKRISAFIRRSIRAEKPFYVAYWPQLLEFFPKPTKTTVHAGQMGDALARLDAYVGKLMSELKELGIAENTLIIAMADNGPMVHSPPAGWGMSDVIYRGGKGDYLEGGVRVPAFAWWPDVIGPGQIVGDIIHETDLFTTFARLGGAGQHIPTDRIIDGIDQTALLLNGDTHGRRDYVFIYQGPNLAATVKGRYKRIWAGVEGADSGLAAAFYDLYHDIRESNPMLVPLIHTQNQFNRMKARHEIWKLKYPDRPQALGVPFTGLSNARPETRAIAERIDEYRKIMPFDPAEYIKFELPAVDYLDPDMGK